MNFQCLSHECRQFFAIVYMFVLLAQYLKTLRSCFCSNVIITILISSLFRSLNCNLSFLVISGTKTNIGYIKHNLIIWGNKEKQVLGDFKAQKHFNSNICIVFTVCLRHYFKWSIQTNLLGSHKNLMRYYYSQFHLIDE